MSTELATNGNTALAIARSDTEELADLIAANLGDGGFSARDLDRVKVPSAGAEVWTIPGIEGNTHSEELLGIIVHWQARKAYWKRSIEDGGGGNAPDCHSEDMKIGIGDPGGPCLSCPFNQFGTAKKGEGKACKDILQLFMVRGDDILPTLVSVPASSIKNVRQYFMRLLGKRAKYYGAVTRLRLSATKSGSGVAYSEIVPSLVRLLDASELARVERYAAAIAAASGSVGVSQAEVEPAAGPEGEIAYWRGMAMARYQEAGADPGDQEACRRAFNTILGSPEGRSRSEYDAEEWGQIALHYAGERPAPNAGEPCSEPEQSETLPLGEDEDPFVGRGRAKRAVKAGETGSYSETLVS